MSDVAKGPNLQLRGNTWYYRRRVPAPLVSILGCNEIKRSLGVTSLTAAKRLRSLEDVKTDALFAAAEAKLHNHAQHPELLSQSDISTDMLVEYVRETVERLDKRNAQRLLADPMESQEQQRDVSMENQIGLEILLNPSDPRGDELIDPLGTRILKELGVHLDPSTSDFTQFWALVRRGLIELYRRQDDRLHDRYDVAYHDNLFNPDQTPTVRFVELVKIYLQEKEDDYRLNGVSQKRLDKVIAVAATIQDIVGGDTPVHGIGDDIVQKVRGTIARLPANRVKLYPKLSISDAIEQASKQAKPVLSPVTQGNYLDVFRDILKIAVRKKLLPNNPAIDIRPLKKDMIPQDQKRLPWTIEQLKGFFEGHFYRSCVPGAMTYAKPDRAWRFWLPLIMLFTGARPNEIAQLYTSDVKRTNSGTWYLDLLDESEDGETRKRLKTSTSRRRIPLHPELRKIGFVEFVKGRTTTEIGTRLFHELTPDKYGNFAAYATRRFRESFIPAEIQLGPRQTLYSLRHNVRDALRRVEAPAETLLAVTGWSPSGKSVSDHYGDPGNPDLHIKWVEKIAYDGLDLSFLHVPGSQVE